MPTKLVIFALFNSMLHISKCEISSIGRPKCEYRIVEAPTKLMPLHPPWDSLYYGVVNPFLGRSHIQDDIFIRPLL